MTGFDNAVHLLGIIVAGLAADKKRRDVSIHPNGRPASNTCKPRKRRTGKLARKARRLSARRNDHSATLKDVDKKRASGYNTPGSMNGHK